MKKTNPSMLAILLILITFVVACTPEVAQPEQPADPITTPEEATLQPNEPEFPRATVHVHAVKPSIMESFPVQVGVTIYGSMSDGCHVFDGATADRIDNTFVIDLEAHKEGDACTMAIIDVETTVILDVEGLPAGTYQVQAGEITAEFTLDIDNQTPEVTPEEPIDSNANTTIYVSRVEPFILESFPVQVGVNVYGDMADGCHVFDGATASREDNLFSIQLKAHTVGDACSLALVPFEAVVMLDVAGLTAGTYQVEANGVVAEFTLDVDN